MCSLRDREEIIEMNESIFIHTSEKNTNIYFLFDCSLFIYTYCRTENIPSALQVFFFFFKKNNTFYVVNCFEIKMKLNKFTDFLTLSCQYSVTVKSSHGRKIISHLKRQKNNLT